MRVVVADDSRVMRKLIMRSLKEVGLSDAIFLEVENGEEAWNIIQGGNVDLAILDIHMPVLTGEELLIRLRGTPRHRDLPVIIVSSESSAARVECLLDHGARFVHKPWSDQDFQIEVRRVLGEKRDVA